MLKGRQAAVRRSLVCRSRCRASRRTAVPAQPRQQWGGTTSQDDPFVLTRDPARGRSGRSRVRRRQVRRRPVARLPRQAHVSRAPRPAYAPGGENQMNVESSQGHANPTSSVRRRDGRSRARTGDLLLVRSCRSRSASDARPPWRTADPDAHEPPRMKSSRDDPRDRSTEAATEGRNAAHSPLPFAAVLDPRPVAPPRGRHAGARAWLKHWRPRYGARGLEPPTSWVRSIAGRSRWVVKGRRFGSTAPDPFSPGRRIVGADADDVPSQFPDRPLSRPGGSDSRPPAPPAVRDS